MESDNINPVPPKLQGERLAESEQQFRNRLSTADQEGRRLWVYPKQPHGKFYRWRTWFSYLQLIVLFGLPFVKIGGQPAIMLNLLERKFIICGHVFWPQDMYLFGLALLTLILFILFVSATLGRIWCGWLCPQTLFMEMVFRKLEYWIEGDAAAQRQINAAPLTPGKLAKKTLKHALFFGLAFVIGNIFLAYIIGIEELWRIVTGPPTAHLAGLTAMTLFALVFYGVYIRFREQMCIMVCPYGRLQSVLQDGDTVMVSYDYRRGEPRGGNRQKYAAGELGDCLDCRQCQASCPTGIDIRNGIQLECINCTACIDACDSVMAKANRAPGLIRYASSNMIAEKTKFRLSTRSIAYGAIFCLLFIVTTMFLARRAEVHAIVTRIPGSLMRQMDEGRCANIYSLQLLNKSLYENVCTLRVIQPISGKLEVSGGQIKLAGSALEKRTFLVTMPKDELIGIPVRITIGIFRGDTLVHTLTTNFSE